MANPCDVIETADKVLDEFVAVAESLRIKYFLYLGTCLGFIRDGGYIKGDNDIDVAVICNSQELEKLFEVLTRGHGFKLGERRGANCHFHKDGILLDVWFKSGDKIKPFLESPQIFLYKDKKYNIPNPVEGFLRLHYGSNWRIPIRK